LDHALASVRSLDLSVAETDERPEETKRRILEAATAAVEQDGAEVLILGCAGMTGYAREIQEKLGLAVIDPAAVTLKLAEAFAELGLMHSKIGLYSPPPQKPFK
jgi:allantoin racemase